MKRLLKTLIFLAVLLPATSTLMAEPYVYVVCSGSDNVYQIETTNNTVVRTLDLNKNSHGVVVHPSGTKMYVTNQVDDSVTVISIATDGVMAIEKTISLAPGGEAPTGIEMNAAGTFVYVANKNSANVSVIDTLDDKLIQTVSAGTGAVDLALRPDASRLYVANETEDSFSIIDTIKNEELSTVEIVGGTTLNAPDRVAVNPAGTRLFVLSTTNIPTYDLTGGNAQFTLININNASDIQIGSNGGFAYITDEPNNQLKIYDISLGTLSSSVTVGTSPSAVVLNKDNSYAYVTNEDENSLSVVDLNATPASETDVPLAGSSSPVAVAVQPVDGDAPAIYSQVPASGGSHGYTSNIDVVFDESMDTSTITSSTFTLEDSSGSGVSGTLEFSSTIKGTQVTFNPAGDLSLNATYTVRLTGGIADLAGNAFSATSWNFTTTIAVPGSDSDGGCFIETAFKR